MSEIRKPLIGYVVIDEYDEDMSHWDGAIAYPNPKGANLFWEKPEPFIQKSAYDELQQKLDEAKAENERLTTEGAGINCPGCGKETDFKAQMYECPETKIQVPCTVRVCKPCGFEYLSGREEHNVDRTINKILEKELAQAKAQAESLAEALEDIFGLLESNQLCRNTADDHESDWAIRQIELVQKLSKANQNLAKFRSGKNGEEK